MIACSTNYHPTTTDTFYDCAESNSTGGCMGMFLRLHQIDFKEAQKK
jgi:hypothetical protein